MTFRSFGNINVSTSVLAVFIMVQTGGVSTGSLRLFDPAVCNLLHTRVK